jgi:hypothetical protein
VNHDFALCVNICACVIEGTIALASGSNDLTEKRQGKLNDMAFVESLKRSDMLTILQELCEGEVLKKQISIRAKALLSDVVASDIEEAVFTILESIMVEELWERSGDTYYGYQEPVDVAHEMVGEAIESCLSDMKQYRALGMEGAEEEYCIGIIAGLLRYGNEGSNDFHDAVPDDPYDIACEVIYEWKRERPGADLTRIQETVNRFTEGWDVSEDSC